ncbi:MAG: acyltransferase [Arenimonas sp.]
MGALRGLKLDEALQAGRDNFLPLRHLAALLVIFGHSYRLSAHVAGQVDFVERWLPGFYAGSLAVYFFFAISGYLVTTGLLRKPGFWRYLRNRFLRVYPAYFACLLATVLVLGPAFTTLEIRDYFNSTETWHYLRTNLSPITLAWKLPGVFAGNPDPGVVNGTLWSLGLEVRWYAYLGLLAMLGVVARRWLFTLVALAFLAFASWEGLQGKPDPLSFRALSMVFMGAALLAQWKHRIRVGHASFATLVLLCAVAHGTRWFFPAAVLAAGWFTLWVAYVLPPLRWPGKRDYSYGLFLYGFPVQQALVAAIPTLAPWQLFTLAAPIALLLAAISWHWLEQPMISFKRERAPALPAETVAP